MTVGVNGGMLYDPATFSDLVYDNCVVLIRYLSLMHLNVCSLRNKGGDVNIFLDSLSHYFQFFACNETWYSDDCENFKIPNYKRKASYRSDRIVGYTAMYINKPLGYSIIRDYIVLDSTFESLVVRSRRHLIGLVYRPPSYSIKAFFEFLG